jgi:ABC-type polysaccharide/polyol phosphate export permease
MISMSFIAFKSVDIYIALVAGLSALLIRFSTAFYPIDRIPSIYQPASYATPLTYGADLSRWVLGYNPQLLLNPTVALVIVVAVAVGTISLSMTIMGRIIEGVKAA